VFNLLHSAEINEEDSGDSIKLFWIASKEQSTTSLWGEIAALIGQLHARVLTGIYSPHSLDSV